MKSYQIKNIRLGEGPPKIIVPLMGISEKQLMEEAAAVKTLNPDIVEWRADVFDQIDHLDAVESMTGRLDAVLKDIPLLFTFRSHKEGGNTVVTDKYYSKLITRVIQTKKIELIDLELFFNELDLENLVHQAKSNNILTVMSNHDFEKTPAKEEIIGRLKLMQKYGADIPKMAVMPKNTEDVLTLLEATNRMREQDTDVPIITMAMGKLGLISRLSGEIFGSAATFAVGKEASAPGQIAIDDLRTVMGILHKNLSQI